MSRIEADVLAVVSVLLSLPLLAVWGFVLFDISRRADLAATRKLAYAAVVVLVFPASLLYLLARPTSVVRHHVRGRTDWRSDLVARLESPPGGPPVVGPREEELLLERVQRLATGSGPSAA